MSKDTVTIGFRLKRPLKEWLLAYAKAHDLTPTQVLRRLVREHHERTEKDRIERDASTEDEGPREG